MADEVKQPVNPDNRSMNKVAMQAFLTIFFIFHFFKISVSGGTTVDNASTGSLVISNESIAAKNLIPG
jgi:hypothetical protein